MTWRGKWTALPRWQKGSLVAAVVLLLYAVVGFFVAPPIVRSQGEQALREAFGRESRIGEVALNPFVLSATVRDFSLPDRDGSPFVRFDELYVDFQLSSIFRRAYTFGEVRLVRPFVHIEVQPDGTLNFADLLAADADDPDGGADDDGDGEEDGGPPPLIVGLARIEGGRVLFSDEARATRFEHEISPLDVELRDFGTRPDDHSPYSFTATTGAGEALVWEGTVSVVPLYSSGTFALTGVRPRTGWLYVQDDVFFEIVDGTVDVRGQYTLDTRNGFEVGLDEGEIIVRDFAVADRETDERVVVVPELDVRGIAVAYPAQTVGIDRVTSSGGRYHMLRLEDGHFRVEQLARTRSTDVAAGTAEPDGDDEAGATPDPGRDDAWAVSIGEVRFEGHRFEFEDRSTPEPVTVVVDPLGFSLRSLTNDPSKSVPVVVELGLAEDGRVRVEGEVTPEPLDADLQIAITDVDLRAFQSYWAPVLAVGLSSGRFGAEGRLRLRDGTISTPRIEYGGDLRVDALRTVDRRQGNDLIAWSALELDGLALTVEPTSIRLERLGLRDPAARVVIAADGRANLATLMAEGEEPADSPPVTPDTGEAESVPVSIGLVELVGGSATFEDRTIEPRFSTGVERLRGTIEGLSSDANARAKVALEGELDGATPVSIGGTLSPLAPQPSLDLVLAFQNFELTPFTPYSGRYLGRAIARGKLFVDLHYVLEHPDLVGENEIFLDQLTLGDDVESPDATDLPIGLAIGLLKDRNGEIHIDLPVRGHVDDPEFSVAGLVGRALRNLVVKVAASPFAMMGRLAGGDGDGEAMRYVAFAPGSAALDPDELGKLDALAGALDQRPALSVELTGTATVESDRPALQDEALEAELRRTRFRERQDAWFGRKPASVDEVVLSPEERGRLLARMYEERFDESPDAVLVPTGVAATSADAPTGDPGSTESARENEMARRLREQIPVDSAALRALARARSTAVRDRLVQSGIAPDRVFVLEADVEETASDAGPRTALDLAAH